jgi:superfamily I DNA/RNA helicase
MQYELMRVLADACGGYVSVVGDPDQSSKQIWPHRDSGSN